MSTLVDWAFARARTVCVLLAAIVGGGMYAYTTIPREGEPNIDIPFLLVSAPFAGVSVADNERLVAKPLEDEFSDLRGLKEMTSYVSPGFTGILLEFDINFDKEAALNDVRTKIDDVRPNLPDDLDEPKVIEQNIAEFPVISIALSGDVPERTLVRVADELERALLNLPRVQEVDVAGVRDEIIELVVDPLRLESYDASIDQMLRAVNLNSALVQAGDVETEHGSFAVKLSGTFTSAADILATPFFTYGERTVTFGDVAEVRRTYEDPSSRARINGEPAIILQPVKALGENVIETVADVRHVVAEARTRWPEPLQTSIRITPALDQSEQAGGMIDQMENSVVTAVILILVLVIALVGPRPALLIGTAIPCSFLITFCLLEIFGMSINNMVVFGLTLSVGMLIDGAIVIVEYADRRRSEGATGAQAYHDASKRMFWPIITSTATTLSAFLPMLLWPGIAGQFMRQLPITLIFVLCSSLAVALIFLPVIGSLVQHGKKATASGAIPAPTGAALAGGFVGRTFRMMIANPALPFVCLLGAAGVIFAVVTTYIQNNRGVEFFVDTEPEQAIAYIRARGNLSFEEVDRLVTAAARRTDGIVGIETRVTTSGLGGVGEAANSGSTPQDSIGQIYFEFVDWGEGRPNGDEIIAEIAARTADLPGVIVEVNPPNEGPQQGKPIAVELRASNWDTLLQETARVREQFERIEGLTTIDDTRPLPGIEWDLTIDREIANSLGASVVEAGTIVRLMTRGVEVGTYRPSDTDDELDLLARFPANDRVLDTLDQVRLRTEAGLVPLSSFITRQPVPAIGSISRRHGDRILTVNADVAEGHNTNEKIQEILSWLDTTEFAPGVTAEFRGELEDQQESQQFLIGAFALALMLMFAILLLEFNSFFAVFLVLLAVVLSVAGVLLGMLVMQQPFSIIMSGIGVVALAGIVVNNNIILIDTYQNLCRQMHELDAIAGAVARRVRPVLLTTITTMAGLCPMMFAISVDFLDRSIDLGHPSALWWVQLATAIVFGLGFSTVLTLVVTPSALAARYWIVRGSGRLARTAKASLSRKRAHEQAERQRRQAVWTAYNQNGREVIWGGD